MTHLKTPFLPYTCELMMKKMNVMGFFLICSSICCFFFLSFSLLIDISSMDWKCASDRENILFIQCLGPGFWRSCMSEPGSLFHAQFSFSFQFPGWTWILQEQLASLCRFQGSVHRAGILLKKNNQERCNKCRKLCKMCLRVPVSGFFTFICENLIDILYCSSIDEMTSHSPEANTSSTHYWIIMLDVFFFLLSDYASSSMPNRRAVVDQLCPHQRQGAAV